MRTHENRPSDDQLEQELAESRRNLHVLMDVNRQFAATLNLEDLFQASTDGITELTGLNSAAVYLLQGDQLLLQATTPPIPADFPDQYLSAPLEDHPHIQRCLDTGQPQSILDTKKAALTTAEQQVTELRGLRSIFYFPIQLREEPAGVLIVSSRDTPGQLDSDQVELCRILVSQAALAIENAQVHKQLKEYAENLESLVSKRTEKLDTLVQAMSGREVRMAELKKVNRKLAEQLREHGLTPAADDPLLE